MQLDVISESDSSSSIQKSKTGTTLVKKCWSVQRVKNHSDLREVNVLKDNF